MKALGSAEFFACAVVVVFAYGVIRVLDYFSVHVAWWPL